VLQFSRFKAAGTAPQSMVADFLISHQDDGDKDSENYQELEAAMKAVAATVYIGEHCIPSYYHVLIVTIP
jgi:hypothetical protein